MGIQKKNFFVLLAIISLIIPYASAEVSSFDKAQIQNQIKTITNSINNNDINSILNIISPNAGAELRTEIENNLAGSMMQFQQSVSSYEDLGNNQVKVKGRYAAAGPGWNVNGMPNFFIFERSGDSWLLVDTDFHQKLGSEYVLGMLGKIFAIIIPIFIIFGVFWLWMLIDAIKRQFENKTLWIILIIVLSFLGAILYFFIVRRKLKQQEKQQSSQSQQQNLRYRRR
jgi:preprotein translocase subunit YajC